MEGRLHGVTGAPTRCCLIRGVKLSDSKSGYYISIFEEEDFPNLRYLSLTPPDAQQNGYRIALLTTTGWQDIAFDDALQMPEVRMALTAFERLLTKQSRTLSQSEIDRDNGWAPPIDPECDRRLMLVHKGRMPVSVAYAKSEMVAPYSHDHCLQIPELDERLHQDEIPILTYWKDGKFVMSDDYLTYVTNRRAKNSEFKMSVMGAFPDQAARVVLRGGSELLPPILIISSRDLKKETRSPCPTSRPQMPSDLMAAWLTFADHLSNELATERQLHNFLSEYPIAISAYSIGVDSEFRLADRYRIDLIVRSRGIRDDVLLIELELHQQAIFTADGRLRHEVTHAKQQVKDWLRWLRENPDDEFAKSLTGLSPKGLVVVGKSRSLTEEQRSRLAHLNEGDNVQIVTYDELLDRFGDLILDRCDPEPA